MPVMSRLRRRQLVRLLDAKLYFQNLLLVGSRHRNLRKMALLRVTAHKEEKLENFSIICRLLQFQLGREISSVLKETRRKLKKFI